MKLDKDVKLEKIADLTENYVGADIEAICSEAGIDMLEQNITNRIVNMKHFKSAINKVRPSISSEIEENYKRFEQEFKKRRGKDMDDESNRSYIS